MNGEACEQLIRIIRNLISWNVIGSHRVMIQFFFYFALSLSIHSDALCSFASAFEMRIHRKLQTSLRREEKKNSDDIKL